MDDLLLGAKFGDKFRTRDGRVAIYIKKSEKDTHWLLFEEGMEVCYKTNGRPKNFDKFPIIQCRYNAHIPNESEIAKCRVIADDFLAMVGADDPVHFFKSRKKEDVDKRHVLLKIMRDNTRATYATIARICLSNHVTVIKALDNFEDRRKYVPDFDKTYKELYIKFNSTHNYES